MTSLAKPFVLDFFQICDRLIVKHAVTLGQNVPVNNLNVASMEAERGKLTAPLSFMLLAHHHYPTLMEDIVLNAPETSSGLMSIQDFSNQIADGVGDYIGRDKVIAVTNPQSVTSAASDDYARYLYNVTELTLKTLASYREKIVQAGEGDITFSKAATMYGALSAMQSMMLCFETVPHHIAAFMDVGQDPLKIAQYFLECNDFVDTQNARVKPVIAKGYKR